NIQRLSLTIRLLFRIDAPFDQGPSRLSNFPQNSHAPWSASLHPLPSLLLLHLRALNNPSTNHTLSLFAGYTQSGPLFHSKTRALHKALTKALPAYSIHLSYPTAPIHLDPSDIPGYNGPSTKESKEETEPAYGWWRRKDMPNPSQKGETSIVYTGLQDGMARIAEMIAEEGPFDGVIGFSQGACAAAMVASLLEPGRRDAFASTSSKANEVETEPFPSSFESLHKPPLKFAMIYSGFIAPGNRYINFYRPSLKTPTLHFLGALDGVVEEGRSQGLIKVCEGAKVVTHPGGHFLPSQRPWLDAAVGFVKECLEQVTGSEGGQQNGGTKEDDNVEDMDVPF
ncbi:MAG: hypothetical protein Q9168_003818, partial [Polycauliona sp. 1 TL-2023]